ncbi:MAG: 4-hydroxy-tetrahydrodipicolinate reductase [Cyclobacteriaceae bacterium]
MNIGLIGYGKMGQTIEKIAKSRGHVISHIIDVTNIGDIEKMNPDNTDAVIEFTRPEAAYSNIKSCITQGVPVISGTTGWLGQYDELKDYCIEKNGAFLSATNFSLGVNIFFKLNEWLSNVMKSHEMYNVSIEEIHHTQKLDEPSGTAITLAEGIIDNSHKLGWKLGDASKSEIPVTAIRETDVPGTHTINYESAIDSIEIKHTAKTREGFALGAVLVAEWIKGKTGVFTMNDFINI